jgi:hypothetical protein
LHSCRYQWRFLFQQPEGLPFMPIRFAPSRRRDLAAAVLMRGMWNQRIMSGANDNGDPAASDEALLVDTLRHFGTHGLRSAEAAAQCARAARDTGDHASFTRWLSVCRMLDRRKADALEGAAAWVG